ncbi:MAG: hypothetical protein V1866_05645 [archaeon]
MVERRSPKEMINVRDGHPKKKISAILLAVLLLLALVMIVLYLAILIPSFPSASIFLKIASVPLVIALLSISVIVVSTLLIRDQLRRKDTAIRKALLIGGIALLAMFLLGVAFTILPKTPNVVLTPVEKLLLEFSEGINRMKTRSEVDTFPVSEYDNYFYLSATRHAARDPGFAEPPGLNNIVSWDDLIMFNITRDQLADMGRMPFQWAVDELTPLNISNSGFDRDDNGNVWPDDWNAMGNAEYVSDNCLSGKCLHVDVDDSEQGYFLLNSKPVDVDGGNNYTFSFDINCISCGNDSAYMVMRWFTPDSINKKSFAAGPSHILYLHDTTGYERFTISVQAPVLAVKALVGVRVHLKKAYPKERTQLYIDGSDFASSVSD